MVAHDDWNSVQCRLDDIVSTARDEAPANERHIGQRVKRREFANRVNQQNATGNRIAAPQRTSPEADPKLLDQFGHFAEPLRMTRRQDQGSARMTGQNIHKGLQQNRFFAIDCATTNNHRADISLLEHRSQAGDDRRRRGRRRIKFQVAGYVNSLSRNADFLEAASIFLSLSQKKIDLAQNSAQQIAEATVPWPRAVRDSRVHHRNSRAAGMSKPQEVWPELGFCDDNQLGAQQAQVWPDGKGEVQREVKNVVLPKAISSQLLTGVRRGRDYHSIL